MGLQADTRKTLIRNAAKTIANTTVTFNNNISMKNNKKYQNSKNDVMENKNKKNIKDTAVNLKQHSKISRSKMSS